MSDLPDAATFLDALESAGNCRSLPASWPKHAPAIYPNASFLHSGWQQDRLRIARAYEKLGKSVHKRLNFATCGGNWFVLRNKTDPTRFKLSPRLCRDRFCLICGRRRAAVIQANLVPLTKGRPTRFITLTIAQDQASLAQRIDRLMSGFRRLRRLAIWRERITAAAAFLEVKWSEKARGWHPHLHVVALGRFVPQGQLSAAWRDVTGDSFVVDIRLAQDRTELAKYLTKYVTKPIAADVVRDPDRLAEAIRALDHRKLIIPLHGWARAKLTKPPEDSGWESLGTIYELTDAENPLSAMIPGLAERLRGLPPRAHLAEFVFGRSPPIEQTAAGSGVAAPPRLLFAG